MKKIKAPFEIVGVIVKRNMSDKVVEILKANSSDFHLVCMAEGTASTQVMEMFGFGMESREVVWGLIKTEEIKNTLKILSKEMDFDDSTNGIAFTLPLTSATSVVLEMAKKLGGKKNEN